MNKVEEEVTQQLQSINISFKKKLLLRAWRVHS